MDWKDSRLTFVVWLVVVCRWRCYVTFPFQLLLICLIRVQQKQHLYTTQPNSSSSVWQTIHPYTFWLVTSHTLAGYLLSFNGRPLAQIHHPHSHPLRLSTEKKKAMHRVVIDSSSTREDSSKETEIVVEEETDRETGERRALNKKLTSGIK